MTPSDIWERRVAALEGASAWSAAALLGCWILVRNLIEGVLERPHQLGFDWREDLSAPMVFLHFPLYYGALFAGIVLLLHAITRRPAGRIARAVSLGYGLILLAPLIDAAVSRGRGYDLKYLLGFGSFLWRFWSPASLAEVSPGQRVEIARACMAGAAYVFATGSPRRRRAARVALAAAAGAGIYLLAAALGAWPSWFARITVPRAGTAEAAYLHVFRLGGLVPNESRRLAIVLALPLLAMAPVLFRLADPRRFGPVVKRIPMLRLLYYTGLVPAGAWIACAVYRNALPAAFSNPADVAAVVVLWSGMVCAFLAALLWNDLHDRDTDRINAPGRPVVHGDLSPEAAGRAAAACAAGAVFLALCVSYPAFLLMLGCLFLAWAYSAPPLRLKRFPLLATATLAALSWIAAVSGFSLCAQEAAPLLFPRALGASLFLGVALGFGVKDLKDVPGDRASGTVTLGTLLPDAWARRVLAALVVLGYCSAPVLLRMGWGFLIVTLLFAAASAAATLRMRRPDQALLAMFALYAVVVLLFLSRNPERLRDGVPVDLRPHATLLGIEDEVRGIRIAEEGWAGGALPSDSPEAARLRRTELLGRIDAILGAPPAVPSDRERLTWAHAQIASPAEAGTEEAELLGISPFRAAYHDAAFRTAVARGDPDGAVEACSRAIRAGVRPGDFYRNRAAVALAAGRHGAEVRRDLASAALFGGDRAGIGVLSGDDLVKSDRPAEAAEVYRRAAQADPASPEPWAGLGAALSAQKDAAGAVAAFERARALNPKDAWILNNLGVALREAGRLAEARARFEEAHGIAPDLFEPVFNLGQTCERLGEPDAALEWYGRARQMRPGFPPVEEAWTRVARNWAR